MAMSLSQPDPASPASVADASFGTARRGFDQGQVRAFLRMVAAELGRLQERERFLERELRVAQTNPDLDAAHLDDAALTRLLGEETARVLTTARESAREIREKAEENAARLLSEASEEAARVREQADLDAARVRADATADAESEIEMAKQQGRDMVTEARAYRERVLSELARRRELAREQIEQLIHGRDRLIQAFERARLAAVDVVSELEPLGEPSEYVNLTPTTGPVPVMVPNARPDAAAPTEALPRTLDPSHDADDADDAAAGGVDVEEDLAGDDGPVDEDLAPAADDASGGDRADPHVDGAEVDGAAGDVAVGDDAQAAGDVAPGDEDEAEAAGDVAVGDEDAAGAEVAGSVTSVEADDDGTEDQATSGAAPEDAGVEAGADTGQADDDGGALAGDDGAADGESDEVAGSYEADDSGAATDEEPAGHEVQHGAAVGSTASSGDDRAVDDTDGVTVEDERDDVVVDLFARLRAGATAPTDVRAETVDEAESSTGDASEAAADSTVVGELSADDAAIEDGGESPFTRRDADLTPLIVASGRKLKRVLADEQNGVLEVLRGDAGVRELDELLTDGSEQAARYARSIADELTEAARAGARSIDAEHELDDDDAAAARASAGEMVTDWLVIPLRDRLERCVDEGDGDNVAISRRIRSVYREWKTQHIDEQLDDVLRAAYGRGALGAAAGTEHLVWLVDREHPACPDCDDNSLSPPVVAGDPFPTGHTFAPAHPGCRCLVALPDR